MQVSINTSVDDLRSSLQCSIEHYTEVDMLTAIDAEKKDSNRRTVILLLNRAIKAKRAGKKTI